MICPRCGFIPSNGGADCACSARMERGRWSAGFWVALSAAAVVGFAATQILGRALLGKWRIDGEYFLTKALDGFDSWGLRFLGLGTLFVVGLLCAAPRPREGWLIGLGTVVLYPVAIVVECTFEPSAHNLLPFEIIIYGPMAAAGLAGGVAGGLVGRELGRDRPRRSEARR